MAADLRVALHARRALLHVKTAHNGILSVLFLDVHQSLLDLLLAVALCLLGFFLLLDRFIVGEKIQLLVDFFCPHFGFRDDAARSYEHAAHEQIRVHDRIIESGDGVDDDS